MKLNLTRYSESWEADDPHANFKAEVANYTAVDPLPTIENLSWMTGIPVGSLVRYILVKWAASGSEAMLAMPPYVVSQMQGHVQRAEEADTDEARLEAYEALRQMIGWLDAGIKDSEAAPGGEFP